MAQPKFAAMLPEQRKTRERMRRTIYDWTNRIWPWLNTSIIGKSQGQRDRDTAQKCLRISAEESHILGDIVRKFNEMRREVEPIEGELVNLYAKIKAGVTYRNIAEQLESQIAALSGAITRDIRDMEHFTDVYNELLAINAQIEKLSDDFDKIDSTHKQEEAEMKRIIGMIQKQQRLAIEINGHYDTLVQIATREFGLERNLSKLIEAERKKIKKAELMLKGAFAAFRKSGAA